MKSAVICLIFALVGCACLASCDRSLNWDYGDGVSIKTDFYAESESDEDGNGKTDSKAKSAVGGYGSTEDGDVELYGRAKSIAKAEAESECKAALYKVFKYVPKPYYVNVKKYSAAYGKVFAETLAKAAAETYVHAKSTGETSKGCVSATAVGKAAASAFGAIYLKVIVLLKSRYGWHYVRPLSEYQYTALFSKAAAHSYSKVCVKGNASAEAYKKIIAEATAEVTLKAFIAACYGSYYGGVSGGKADIDQTESAKGYGYTKTEAEEDGEATGHTVGGGYANSGVKTLCKSVEEYKHCCGGYYFPAPRHCPYGKCPEKKKCTLKKNDYSKKVYEIDGNLCVCEYY